MPDGRTACPALPARTALKPRRHDPPLRPAPAAAPYTCGAAVRGVQLTGGDLAGMPLKNASSLAQCCGACLAAPGCGAYSWEPAASQCWLKSPKATGQWAAEPDPKFTSAVVLWAPIQSERWRRRRRRRRRGGAAAVVGGWGLPLPAQPPAACKPVPTQPRCSLPGIQLTLGIAAALDTPAGPPPDACPRPAAVTEPPFCGGGGYCGPPLLGVELAGGSGVGQNTTQTFELCCDACQRNPACGAFVYVPRCFSLLFFLSFLPFLRLGAAVPDRILPAMAASAGRLCARPHPRPARPTRAKECYLKAPGNLTQAPNADVVSALKPAPIDLQGWCSGAVQQAFGVSKGSRQHVAWHLPWTAAGPCSTGGQSPS